MLDEKLVYEEQFNIRASEVGFDHTATLPAICNLLQEVAGNHARALSFDITDLHKENLTWVLHRLAVNMRQYPEWRETITIRTWPSSGNRLRAYRDFQIFDSNKNLIGNSLSYWLIMDIESRRPKRIPSDIIAMAPENTEHVIPVTEPNFREVNKSKRDNSFDIRKTDLDLNRHVNNVRYIEWALSCLPEEKKATDIDIQFKSEAVSGDTVIAKAAERDQSSKSADFDHQLVRKGDQKLLASAITKTQPISTQAQSSDSRAE